MKKIFFLTALSIISASCIKDFESINKDPNLPTPADTEKDGLNISGYLGTIQNQVVPAKVTGTDEVNLYQIAFNMMGDSYAGYFAPPENKWNNELTMITGYMADHWMNGIYSGMFNSPIASWRELKKNTIDKDASDVNNQTVYQMGQICKVMAVLRATDMFGPLPYLQQGKGLRQVPYDDVKSIYYRLFEELTEANNVIKQRISDKYTLPSGVRQQDVYYAGDLQKWAKLANSVRLRMALRIRYADPNKAKEEAQAAITAGVMTELADAAKVQSNDRLVALNCLEYIARAYGDTRAGATVLSYLDGYSDPRKEKYFKVNPTEKADGYTIQTTIRGIRAGYKGGKAYMGFAFPGMDENSPTYVMKASEVYFLRAEAKLFLATTDDTDASLYQKGIEMSFTENGVSAADYVNNTTKKPANYTDPINSTYSAGVPSTVTIAYSGTEEEKLEKIITQKYLAIFPDGHEAWTEWRRTGYPKQILSVQYKGDLTHGNTIISPDGTSKGVRRAIYPQSEYNINRENMIRAVQLIGNGAVDDSNSHIWWDANPRVR